MIQTITTNQCIVCMSVQCVHGTQGEPWNEAMYVHGLPWCLFTCMYSSWMWQRAEMFILTFELQVGHSHYSWTVLSSPVTHWLLKLLTNWFYFTIHTTSQSTLKTKVLLYTSPLSYKHCKLKWEKSVNTRIKHFSNPFSVYSLPAHTNVDTDAPLR